LRRRREGETNSSLFIYRQREREKEREKRREGRREEKREKRRLNASI
jgi:hypothetical protein